MIVVRVELWSARTGQKTELARMHIYNDETGGTFHRNYKGRSLRGRSTKDLDKNIVQRTGEVKNHPAVAKHVWNLVAKMLSSMGYG